MQRAGGFTLVELLLVVSMVLMLASAAVFNFSTLLRGNQLEEGTTRLETLMRFARAQAANSGRKVQLVFSNDATNADASAGTEVRATWESDPLSQPGCFTALEQAQFHVQEVNDMVQVESVKLLDSARPMPSDSSENEDPEESGAPTNSAAAKPIAPITFYPDGSCDSAEIIVAARSTEEDQRMAVRLVGLTGSVSHQLLSSDTDEVMGESGSVEGLPLPAQLRREPVVRDASAEHDPVVKNSSARPAAASSSFPAVQPNRRSTVGETNSVDQSE